MAWINDDGLQIKFGTEEVEVAAGGFQKTFDGQNVTLKFFVIAEELAASGTTSFLSDTTSIPNGAYLESATFKVTEAFASTGNNATLTFGLYDTDHTTEFDADGIDATIAEADIDALGDTITCDGTVVGTIISNTTPVLVTALVGTTDFDLGGAGVLTLVYSVPRNATLS